MMSKVESLSVNQNLFEVNFRQMPRKWYSKPYATPKRVYACA